MAYSVYTYGSQYVDAGQIGIYVGTREENLRECLDVIAAEHIPGENQCGPIVHDDPILADAVVQYLGQPVFAVIAHTRDGLGRVQYPFGTRQRDWAHDLPRLVEYGK